MAGGWPRAFVRGAFSLFIPKAYRRLRVPPGARLAGRSCKRPGLQRAESGRDGATSQTLRLCRCRFRRTHYPSSLRAYRSGSSGLAPMGTGPRQSIGLDSRSSFRSGQPRVCPSAPSCPPALPSSDGPRRVPRRRSLLPTLGAVCEHACEGARFASLRPRAFFLCAS